MELYLQPNLWSCLPTSFGMILGLTPKEMFEAIGHDGSEIVWPQVDDPSCRRAFHIQECIIVALQQMMFPVEIEVESYATLDDYSVEPFKLPYRDDIFEEQLKLISGVLLGRDHRDKPHAVAWNRQEQMIYDPVGYKYNLSEFKPVTFYGVY
jgi:hypothetical protein